MGHPHSYFLRSCFIIIVQLQTNRLLHHYRLLIDVAIGHSCESGADHDTSSPDNFTRWGVHIFRVRCGNSLLPFF